MNILLAFVSVIISAVSLRWEGFSLEISVITAILWVMLVAIIVE